MSKVLTNKVVNDIVILTRKVVKTSVKNVRQKGFRNLLCRTKRPSGATHAERTNQKEIAAENQTAQGFRIFQGE